jgi:hypothetical protein
MFAVTYVYQKCFRQQANVANLQENDKDHLDHYKALDFEIGEQEPVLNESRRSRLNTDTTYLHPVFERTTSSAETHGGPRTQEQAKSDDLFTEATTSLQAVPPNVSANLLDQDSNYEPPHHVYVEILDDNDVDVYKDENVDGNTVESEDPSGERYSPDGREFDYVNVDD